jgi:hypothetical protein
MSFLGWIMRRDPPDPERSGARIAREAIEIEVQEARDARQEIQDTVAAMARDSTAEVTRQRQLQRTILGNTGNLLEDSIFWPDPGGMERHR